MIGKTVRWIRVVLPPAWTLAVFLAMYLVPLSLYLWLKWTFAKTGYVDDDLLWRFLRLSGVTIILAAAAYGAYRVWAFHPAARAEYRNWLALTPWTPQDRMPLGPIHLAWQDIVVLATLVLLLPRDMLNWDIVVAAFLFTYLFGLALLFSATDVKWVAYLLVFILGMVLRVASVTYLSMVILAAGYCVALIGLRQQLSGFPWTHIFARRGLKSRRWVSHSQSDHQVGWPFDLLHPYVFGPTAQLIHKIAISLLAGWWSYILGSLLVSHATADADPGFAARLMHAGLWMTIIVLVGTRLWVYCACFRPPINFWGRIFTLRWIVPEYDYVFFAPLCTVLIGFVAPPLLLAVGFPDEIMFGMSQMLILLVILDAGPSYDRWILTGGHRIVPGPLYLNREKFRRL